MACWWFLASLATSLLDALVASVVSLLAAVLLTTTVSMRIYEMRPLYMVGLFANRVGAAHLGIGLGWGAGASLFVVGAQWAGGWARVERGAPPDWLPTLGFGFLVLLAGATGEELLFRGYGFQHVMRAFGPRLAIVSTSGLFAWSHVYNPAFSYVALFNTVLFGIVFGYAYWRTRDLWLPLGMHFAWNLTLATIGAQVSGLKIKLTALTVVAAGSPLWSGGAYGPEASLWATVALVAAMAFLWKAPLGRQTEGVLAFQEAKHETVEPDLDRTAGGGPRPGGG
jgi:membrane protease YdiL (CAAX protease family)